MESKRAIPAVGRIITELRLSKGCSVETLANKANLSTKTIQEAEQNENKFAKTLKKIAAALGTDVDTLRGIQQPIAGPGGPVTIILNARLTLPSSDDSATARQLLLAIQTLLATQNAIELVSVKRGSLIITCQLMPIDILRLIASFADGDLESLGITDIDFPPYEALTHGTNTLDAGQPVSIERVILSALKELGISMPSLIDKLSQDDYVFAREIERIMEEKGYDSLSTHNATLIRSFLKQHPRRD